MNYDKVDELLAKAGCKFEFLHGYDYENFCPYAFAKLIIGECIRVPYDMWGKAELNADVAVKIEHGIKELFGVE